MIHEIPRRLGEVGARRFLRARESTPSMQFLHDRRRPIASQYGTVVGRQFARIREVLDPIDAREEFQGIGHAAIHLLKGDQLSSSMRETADLHGLGGLSGEQSIEDGRGIGLHARTRYGLRETSTGRWRLPQSACSGRVRRGRRPRTPRSIPSRHGRGSAGRAP